MGWRLAKSLMRLRDQVDIRFPARLKGWDGTIGDAAHAQRHSEHNPDARGVVRAIDITHDVASGFDSYKFADELKAAGDKRIYYVISNRRIWNPSVNPNWRPYSGENPHTHHVHISVVAGDVADSTDDWIVPMLGGKKPQAPASAKSCWLLDAIFGLFKRK